MIYSTLTPSTPLHKDQIYKAEGGYKVIDSYTFFQDAVGIREFMVSHARKIIPSSLVFWSFYLWGGVERCSRQV